MDSININVFKQIKNKKNETSNKDKIKINKNKNDINTFNNVTNFTNEVKKNVYKNKITNPNNNYNNINKTKTNFEDDFKNLNLNKITVVSGIVKDSNTNKLESHEFKIKTRSQPEPNFEYSKNNKNSQLESEENKMIKNILVQTVKKNKLTEGTIKMMENDRKHANEAIESGIYITWTSKNSFNQLIECFRIGSNSMCICNHNFTSHEKIVTKKKLSTKCKDCKCRNFTYIPLFPEEIGEYWLPYQPNFNYKTWKGKCKCKHSWNEHSAESNYNCSKCNCFSFNSNFCCVVCDKFWQDHEMLYELEHERYMAKKAIGEDFIPFAEMPEMYKALYKS